MIVALGSCLPAAPAPPDPFLDTAPDEVQLYVRNQNYYDATLSAISDTGIRRLGIVGGQQEARFSMPWAVSAGLRVQIDLLAGRTCTTPPMQVNPGDIVELQILAQFDRSDFCG